VENQANLYIDRALIEPVHRAAAALGKLAQRGQIMPDWPTPKQLEQAGHDLGIAAVALSPQLAKQIDRGQDLSFNDLLLPKTMLDINRILDKYKSGRYATGYRVPEAQEVFDAMREVDAKIQPPAIVRHVIDPARREIGQ